MVCGAGQVGGKLKAVALPDKDPACRVAGLVPLLYRGGPGPQRPPGPPRRPRRRAFFRLNRGLGWIRIPSPT